MLTFGDDIVGFLGAVHARRQIGDQAGLVSNLTSWYVRPEHRGWGSALIAQALREQGVTYTAFTPSPAARRVYDAMGFRQLDTCRIVLPPFIHADTLRASRPRISFDPDMVRRAR